ncbi:DUF4244 domain-containing protein [Myceligenerans salitolerans]|uniref:DUF4244 domain-containing protein n=1 Tax=Myceligenerans salitolerans TaxID=1230528 RepID=A0ABS3I9B5_9MICO|nr:DUF4244 domain-containing protein [Myceligenerans salitolerans]MBO0609625.1 DUF4244 domain-containing protein [Myceligenerans salitolerans]
MTDTKTTTRAGAARSVECAPRAGSGRAGTEESHEERASPAAGEVPEAAGPRGAVPREAARDGSEAGMATAEYAIATLGAAGFAGLLMVVLKGGDVKSLLTSLITTALSAS